MRPQDLILYAGGECLEKYGVLVKRTSPAQDSPETHVRASTGYFIDRNGQLRIADQNVPRIEWLDLDRDGVFEAPTLLLEGARTNLLLRSEELDNVAWTSIGSPIRTANQIAFIDGVDSMEKIEDDQSNAQEGVRQSPAIPNDALEYCLSVYIRKLAGQKITSVSLVLTGGTAVQARVNIDQQTGQLVASTSQPPTNFGVENHTQHWRVWLTATNNSSGNTAGRCDITPAWSDLIGTDQGNDSAMGYAFLGGAQLEQGAFPSSYIPTVGTTVTRNADLLSLPFPFPPQEMTILVTFVERGSISAAPGTRILNIGHADFSDPRLFIHVSGGFYSARHDPAAASNSTLSVAPIIGNLVELRVTLSATGVVQIHQSINGAAETSAAAGVAQALGASWSAELLYINESGGANTGFNAFIEIKVARGTRTSAEMRAAA